MLQEEQRRSKVKDAEIAGLLELLSNTERANATLREDVSRIYERIQSFINSREADRVEMSKLLMCIEELRKG